VVFDDEALEPLYIVRQCVDIEHAYIIRAALNMRTGSVCFLLLVCCRTYIFRHRRLHRPCGRRRAIRILGRQSCALRLPPINPLQEHR
jgi:hypothetical protein